MIVDSNIVIDLLLPDLAHGKSSAKALACHGVDSPPVINLVIFAEVASRFASATNADRNLSLLGLTLAPLDREIAFRAGCAFQEYRRRGGPRETILPDFLIGAHADVLGVPILTRDAKRFESYFPDLHLIDPRTFDD